MYKCVLFNFFLLIVIFFSLYNVYIFPKKNVMYLRKKDVIIKYLKASEDFNTCKINHKLSCSLYKTLYKQTMFNMDNALKN
jgi:hypothetical protein